MVIACWVKLSVTVLSKQKTFGNLENVSSWVTIQGIGCADERKLCLNILRKWLRSDLAENSDF